MSSQKAQKTTQDLQDSARANAETKTIRNNLIIFILNGCHNKIPIKESDLLALCHKNRSLLTKCLAEAKEALEQIYGIILAEVKEGTKRFICYSEMPANVVTTFDVQQRVEITLLFLVLSFILITGDSAYEEEIESHLEKHRIYYNEPHPYFGANVKHLITDTFVKQLYLKKEKSDSELDTETKFIYSWGARAKLEFPKEQLLAANEKILKMPIKMFYKNHALDDIDMDAMDTDDSSE